MRNNSSCEETNLTTAMNEKTKSRLQRSISRSTSKISSCSHCKLPLDIDMPTKSRAMSARPTADLCQECNEEQTYQLKSASVNWTNMNSNIETWFEKAKTPDQRVVYNFLHDINQTQSKDLDIVLDNLKKYKNRSNSARPRSKFSRLFESSSWRVLRPTVKPLVQQPTNQAYSESIFQSTQRKMRSTFLIHPNWI